MATIYQKMLAAGVEIDSHESDLYVPANDTTRALLADYEFAESVRSFHSEGRPWFDIPFAYDPFWDHPRPGAIREAIANQPERNRS